MSEAIDSRPTRRDPIPAFRAVAPRVAIAPFRRRARRRAAVAERVAASGLPEASRGVVGRVVAQTRLWHRERLAVADELIAHFADALAEGSTVEQAVAAFGDERVAAALIRRAKRRARPRHVRAAIVATKSVGVFAVLYAMVGVYFATGRASPTPVDYVAQVNAAALATPPADRAWPTYRKALLTLPVHGAERLSDAGVAKLPSSEPMTGIADDEDDRFLRFLDTWPGHRLWPDLVRWLDEHADTVALIREGAAKPHLGYLIGPGGSTDDPELFGELASRASAQPRDNVPVSRQLRELTIDYGLLQYYNLKAVLAAHVRLARERGDSDDVAADLLAIAGLARQMRGAQSVGHQGYGVDAWTLCVDELERTLLDKPDLLTGAHLNELAHALSRPASAADLYDLSFLRADAANILQLTYTDDGNGDGQLTPAGLWAIGSSWDVRELSAGGGGCGFVGALLGNWPDRITNWSVAPAAFMASASRADERAEMDRLVDDAENELATPPAQWIWPPAPERAGLVAQFVWAYRHFGAVAFYQAHATDLFHLKHNAEWMLARRDGVLVGVALELHRRRTGDYPASLAELPATLLPGTPADRITGRPLSYRLVDGAPRVYSVGADRDDDGGRPAAGRDGHPAPSWAGGWSRTAQPPDGDWLLYPAPPAPPDEPAPTTGPEAGSGSAPDDASAPDPGA